MKISELRTLLDHTSSEDMKQIIVEIYRGLPKKTRENLAAVSEPGNIEKASQLLERLYQMLCYACDFVIFSAYDPFEAVGIAQTKFLDAVLGLKAEHLELGEFIDHGLRLIRDSRLNRYTLGSKLVQVLVDRLRTPESLEIAIERAAQLHSKPDPVPDPKREYSSADGRKRLAEFGFLAYFKLSDYDKAINFFKLHYGRSEPEITLYVLLRWLRMAQMRFLLKPRL